MIKDVDLEYKDRNLALLSCTYSYVSALI